MFKSPGAIAFSIGSLDIHFYGIIMALAILISIVVICFVKNKYFKDIPMDSVFDISFILIVFGIIFARLYYVILDFSYFSKNPLEIPAIWNGGISIQGAVLGGIIAGYFYTKANNLNFLRYADLFSFGLIIGQAVGRWGNFFNSEAFGLPAYIPWKLYIPYASRPVDYKSFEYFHPAFLYESLLNILVFIILYLILTKYSKRKDGFIFFSYMILYSVVRIIVESVRLDSVLNIYNLHIAHVTACLFIIFGILGLIFTDKLNNNQSL